MPAALTEHLSALPAAERRGALEAAVTVEFKRVLLMEEADELPLDESFFDLGMTSLALNDVKQRLEDLLDCAIDSTVLFNSPTVEQLVDYLAETALAAAAA